MQISTKEFSELIGVTHRTVDDWIVSKKMPRLKHGVLDLKAAFDWWRDNIDDSDDDDESLKAAKRKYWQAKGEKEQILTEQLKKSLAPISDVLTAWAARVSIVTSGLEMLTNRLPPLLVGRDRDDIQDTLAAEFRALREQYAAKGEHCNEAAQGKTSGQPDMAQPVEGRKNSDRGKREVVADGSNGKTKPPKAVKKQAAKAKAKAKPKPKKGSKNAQRP